MKKVSCKLGNNINVDLSTLIDTRLLIQANSGGGKSYAVRKLLEETHGKVQHIVLDIEGDFSSLREEYDYVLAGKGGDISSDPKHAAYLARKVLELKCNIIVDLYELKSHERIRFVKLFLESMINAPKDLWHPVLIVLDEAHIFCPEKGNSEAMGAVIDLCTRGRKRGFCAVLATQRLSKMHKDAAAECNNKLIGRTGLDIDMKRAGDELGFASKDLMSLRRLSPGEFYVYGPAISPEPVLGMIGGCNTSHPKAGVRNIDHKPAASSTIKSVLSKMGEVAQDAEQEVITVKDLNEKIRLLTAENAKLKKSEIVKIDEKAIERAVLETTKSIGLKVEEKVRKVKVELQALIERELAFGDVPLKLMVTKDRDNYVPVRNTPVIRAQQSSDEKILGLCERKILGFLCVRPDKKYTKIQIGAMTGYRHSSGGFNNAISKLRQHGYIHYDNGMAQIADQNLVRDYVDDQPNKIEDWVNKLGACEKKIYEIVLESPDAEFSKDEIANMTGYSAGSGGFNNAISRLNTLGLIRRQSGAISFNPELRDLGV